MAQRFFRIDYSISGDDTASTRPMLGSLAGPFPDMAAAQRETLLRNPGATITGSEDITDD